MESALLRYHVIGRAEAHALVIHGCRRFAGERFRGQFAVLNLEALELERVGIDPGRSAEWSHAPLAAGLDQVVARSRPNLEPVLQKSATARFLFAHLLQTEPLP